MIPEQPLAGHNPDILTCLANLSADEVFTPPKLASAMLDLLPPELFQSPETTFLDPCCKSGVFLREIARRLNEGLRDQMPDEQARVDHILTRQVFGLATSELTGAISRRSVYCSKKANGKYSISASFKTVEGNIRLPKAQHSWGQNGRCEVCGAVRLELERDESRETYAYPFIHGIDPEKVFNMQFDVIIGNPPYQLNDGGHGASASPIYHKFIESAKSLSPRFLCMVTPSRWFTGGKGLDEFRSTMLKDRRLKVIVDFPKLYDGFPGVKIRGGISYFLWELTHNGPCSVRTMWDGKPLGEVGIRYLDAYDVLVRRNEAVTILEKVQAFRFDEEQETTLDKSVSSGKPFGFRTFFHGRSTPAGLNDPVKLHGSQRTSWVGRSEILRNVSWVDDWKVLMTAVQGTSAAVETMFLSRPKIAGPGEACTETYIVAGRFDSQEQAECFAAYLKTRFVRFLVSLRKATQHATREVYSFVPSVPLDREWSDEALYTRYDLSEGEIAFIESTVGPME